MYQLCLWAVIYVQFWLGLNRRACENSILKIAKWKTQQLWQHTFNIWENIYHRKSRGSWRFGYPMCYHQGFRNVHIFSSVACSTGLIWCWIFKWQPCQCSIDCGTAQLHCSASNTLCFLYQTRMMHCQGQMHIPDTALGVCRHDTYSIYNFKPSS